MAERAIILHKRPGIYRFLLQLLVSGYAKGLDNVGPGNVLAYLQVADRDATPWARSNYDRAISSYSPACGTCRVHHFIGFDLCYRVGNSHPSSRSGPACRSICEMHSIPHSEEVTTPVPRSRFFKRGF